MSEIMSQQPTVVTEYQKSLVLESDPMMSTIWSRHKASPPYWFRDRNRYPNPHKKTLCLKLLSLLHLYHHSQSTFHFHCHLWRNHVKWCVPNLHLQLYWFELHIACCHTFLPPTKHESLVVEGPRTPSEDPFHLKLNLKFKLEQVWAHFHNLNSSF